MNTNEENKKPVFLVSESSQDNADGATGNDPRNKAGRLKKPLVFGLMGVIFLGCMYLVFAPASGDGEKEETGLNDAVPQATDAGLQADKQKAYEQEMLERKMEEKRNGLMSLSDYWNSDTAKGGEAELPEEGYGEGYGYGGNTQRTGNPALSSYRNAQSTLTSFYDNNDDETEELRKQIEELKEQLAEKDVPPNTTVEDQLALMERSYEMAARYLPSNRGNPAQAGPVDTTVPVKSTQNQQVVAFTAARKNAVSALYREPTDSAFLASWNEDRNQGFYTAGISEQVVQHKNSIRAVIQETQTVTDEGNVRLRLLETAQTPGRTIPAGTVFTAHAKFNNGRLQLGITSIELEGNIIPVEITVYDLDGQQGLYVPYSPEMNALTEMAGNMSQTSGTSLMMTRSAGQQVAADLSRGVVQGVSGYFSKKVKTPKVTIKAGHQVFLLSKK